MMDPTERGNIRRYVKMTLFRICEHFFEVVWNIIKITDRNAALIDARKTVKGEGNGAASGESVD